MRLTWSLKSGLQSALQSVRQGTFVTRGALVKNA